MIESISQSKINTWSHCGEQFRRRWIENDIIPPGIAARIGTGVHSGAEANHRAKIKTGKDEPLSVVQDAARQGYVDSLKNGVFFPPDEAGEAKKQIAEGVDTVVGLAALYHVSLAPLVQPTLVEQPITMDVEGFPIPFSGIIDVLTADNWLPDIKTAARKWSQDQADSSVQATIYNELTKSFTGKYPDKISFEVLTKTKIQAHHSIITTRTPADFKVLVRRATIMLDQINAGIFPAAEPGHWICSPKWCGYWWTCPNIAAHRKILPK